MGCNVSGISGGATALFASREVTQGMPSIRPLVYIAEYTVRCGRGRRQWSTPGDADAAGVERVGDDMYLGWEVEAHSGTLPHEPWGDPIGRLDNENPSTVNGNES